MDTGGPIPSNIVFVSGLDALIKAVTMTLWSRTRVEKP
jgi:hypothetical protein